MSSIKTSSNSSMSFSNQSTSSSKASSNPSLSFQLIDSEGTFSPGNGLNDFVTKTKLVDIGPTYAVVATMGPIGIGKSTLLNRVFDTSFPELDASSGRDKKNWGVWLARANSKIFDPCLLVMDLDPEGTDGIERKGDTAFERQAALVLAVSDIVLINMWYSDIGRENGASIPLIRMVFKVFRTTFRSFKNEDTKTTLLILIRDKMSSSIPVENLEAQVIEGLNKIWESVQGTSSNDILADFFNVKVESFSRKELDSRAFAAQVETLRDRFKSSMAQRTDLLESSTGTYRAAVLGTGFSEAAKFVWETTKSNESLNLRTLKGTISNTHLTGVVEKKLEEFKEEWKGMSNTWSAMVARDGVVTGFGKKVNELHTTQIRRQAAVLIHFLSNLDGKTKASYRVRLEKVARENVLPIYERILSEQRDKELKTFKSQLESLASSSTSEDFAAEVRQYKRNVFNNFEKVLTEIRIEFVDEERKESDFRAEILSKIDDLVSTERKKKIDKIISFEKENLDRDLVEFTGTSFESATPDTWFTIGRQLKELVESARSSLSSRLTEFELDEGRQNSFLEQLDTYGRETVEKKLEKKTEVSHDKAIEYMIKSFQTIFSPGPFNRNESTKQEDPIQIVAEWEMLAEKARSSALKVLSKLAVIRLDVDKAYDIVDQTLASLLLGNGHRELTSRIQLTGTWSAEIPPKQTLLNPTECFDIWTKFYSKTKIIFEETLQKLDMFKPREEGWGSFQQEDTKPQYSHLQLTEMAGKQLHEKEWNEIKKSTEDTGVTYIAFVSKVNDWITKQISSFEQKSSNVDEKTRTSYRMILEKEAREIVLRIYQQTLSRSYVTAFKTFDLDLRKWASSPTPEDIFPVAVRKVKRKVLANFDDSLPGIHDRVDYIDHDREQSEFREKVLRKIDVLVSSVRDEKISALISSHKVKMESDFAELTRTSSKTPTHDTLRERKEEVVLRARSSLRLRLNEYELDEATQDSFFTQLDQELDTFGWELVKKQAQREASQAVQRGWELVKKQAQREASQAVQRMVERFEREFDSSFVFTKHRDPIQTISDGAKLAEKAQKARSSALKVLSVLAVIRPNDGLNEKISQGKASDPVEQVLAALLLGGMELKASSWRGIPPERTLLSPLQCSKIWIKFLSETDRIIERAFAPLQGYLSQDGPNQTLFGGSHENGISPNVSLGKDLGDGLDGTTLADELPYVSESSTSQLLSGSKTLSNSNSFTAAGAGGAELSSLLISDANGSSSILTTNDKSQQNSATTLSTNIPQSNIEAADVR